MTGGQYCHAGDSGEPGEYCTRRLHIYSIVLLAAGIPLGLLSIAALYAYYRGWRSKFRDWRKQLWPSAPPPRPEEPIHSTREQRIVRELEITSFRPPPTRLSLEAQPLSVVSLPPVYQPLPIAADPPPPAYSQVDSTSSPVRYTEPALTYSPSPVSLSHPWGLSTRHASAWPAHGATDIADPIKPGSTFAAPIAATTVVSASVETALSAPFCSECGMQSKVAAPKFCRGCGHAM